ncbi:Redoxin [Basidiobolus meristosporus CBS 931.73]|uniref:Thioredoxin-dependent peroxiredoxin n=1 Tax=Basidiobolus meristosporus CBS 931.73 TaxID=1314790 RepID=A0A1Y1ZDQ9_9FUNG|nr:Redoxin [Basidiobolus meristosporus CBS 931.73]|eukprot:ORY08420.1 Redoxin [Basidiobolus meristosporus CBS 931.73]
MSVEVGTVIPEVTLKYCVYDAEAAPNACGIPQPLNTHSVFKGKKVVLFAVPGAFTPTCSNTHLPDFLSKYEDLKAKGVDLIVCLAANDAFVMNAWGKSQNVEDKILMVSDGNLELTKPLGLTQDSSKFTMGERTKRFALVIDDLKVTYVGIESQPGVGPSGVEAVLAAL